MISWSLMVFVGHQKPFDDEITCIAGKVVA
jgi:hypothetical protein